MKVNKLKIAVQNSAWQTVPMVSTLLLSLLVVKWFSVSVWGNIVAILVVQQIANGILAWGNKDYLQRELGLNPTGFAAGFSQLFLERLVLFGLTVLVIYPLGLIDKEYFVSFTLIVFTRFVNQSFDIAVIKERRFSLLLLLELFLLFFQVLLLYLVRNSYSFSFTNLLMVFWLPLCCKSLLLLIIFRKYFRYLTFKEVLLQKSFFFGMLAISGLIHSKIDIFVVSKFLNAENLGKYQIIMSFLWCIQSVSMYISGPFVHNFYRLDANAQSNSSQLLKNIGLIIVPIAISIVMTTLYFVFNFTINLSVIMASLVFSIASFIYLPWIFQINLRKEEHRVLIINIVGTLLLMGLFLGINKFWGLTLEITLWIVAVHQILITLMVFAANKKTRDVE